MTDITRSDVTNQADGASYRVERRSGCVLVFGAVPVDVLSSAIGTASRSAVLDTDLARLAGATMAFGSPADVEAMKASLAPAAEVGVKARYPDLDAAAAVWLATGEQGASSLAIFFRLTGARPNSLLDDDDLLSHPLDPGDLRRCRLLLEQVPAFQGRLGEMREVSPVWAALVDSWSDLCETMDAECPQWRDGRGVARETYAKMAALRSAVSA